MKNGFNRALPALIVLLAAAACAPAGSRATIREETRTIRTYPFGDPDPLPILARSRNAAIYPYFRYDGFSSEGRDQSWKVVRLENDYLIVDVLPEVGGKVLGAVEKSTGRDFLYWNDVLKFRDVAMRGPWTSGGIEFNFGLIGHTPATATPVDYLLRENGDGSVSCIVGTIDLPGRTEWRVEIRLPADAAYFETRSTWHNPTPLTQPYYQWMNAAVDAREDLQFFYPGHAYIGHGGDVHPWPVNENGIDLSRYANHHFGGNKSLHVLGSRTGFSGGYWHELGFGFGHWARYEDMPGRKIWIWSLARSGAIWEDLLTDSNGQYVEVQSGRQFSQANASSGVNTPFTQAAFAPYTTDTWTETWFPIKGIGGLVAANRRAALNVTRNGDRVRIALNALEPLEDVLMVTTGGPPGEDGYRLEPVLLQERLRLEPMAVFEREIPAPAPEQPLVVRLGGEELWSEEPVGEDFARPVRAPEGRRADTASRTCLLASQQELLRVYDRAIDLYRQCVEQDPLQIEGMTRLAELHYRRMQYAEARGWTERALGVDTYDSAANFMFGVTLRALGQADAAREALGWAARSPAYRSGAYTQIAEIQLASHDDAGSVDTARRALETNRANVSALAVLAMAARRLGRAEEADAARRELLRIDPLNHVARAEAWRANPSSRTRDFLTSAIRSELPHESYLELAIAYARVGFVADALEVLRLAPRHPIVDYWLAYLLRNAAPTPAESDAALDRAATASPRLVFPFRAETMPVLEWALSKRRDWTTMYYAALIDWSRGRLDEAAALFAECGDRPDFGAFYLTRTELARRLGQEPDLQDIARAHELAPDDWRTWIALARAQAGRPGMEEAALTTIRSAAEKFPESFIVGLEHARQLIDARLYEDALAVLDRIVVLPYENASEGRQIYERAHLMLAGQRMREGRYEDALAHIARSREWPEHLGVGRPYTPDERLQDVLEARASRQLGRPADAPPPEAVARLRADLQRSNSWKLALLALN